MRTALEFFMQWNSRLWKSSDPWILFLYFILFWDKIAWPWEILSLHFCPTLLNPNSADALSSARLLAVPVSCSKGKPFVLSPFGQFSFFFFPVIGVCEAFPAGKCTSQAAGPNVQRERSLGTSYDTDIWQIDLTSLSPPLLDNALIPRVKPLLNAGTLKMWLASALQSTWRALLCADLSLKEVKAPPVSPAWCRRWRLGFGEPASVAESCSVISHRAADIQLGWGMIWRDWSREVLGGGAAITAWSPNNLQKVASSAQELEGCCPDSSPVSPLMLAHHLWGMAVISISFSHSF